jgi:hypothetical protein
MDDGICMYGSSGLLEGGDGGKGCSVDREEVGYVVLPPRQAVWSL